MAMNLAGKRQNQTEATVTPSKILPTVYKHAPDFEWIVVDEVTPITQEYFEKVIGVPKDVFFNYACHIMRPRFNGSPEILNTFFRPREVELAESTIRQLDNNKIVQKLMEHVIKYKSPVGDLTRFDSWGLRKGRLTLVDYGLTFDIYNRCYRLLEKDYTVPTSTLGKGTIYQAGCVVPLELYEEITTIAL
jgi:hypothetical protein